MTQYLYNESEFVLKGRSYFSPVLLNAREDMSLVERQKGESQNGGNKKTKHTKFSVSVRIRG